MASRELFGGQGSMGNGGAMRAGPLGAYFADVLRDDLPLLIEQARLSAEVTHAHAEGQAGAIAVALAAAFACHDRREVGGESGSQMLAFAHAHTPAGPTRDGIGRARELAPTETVERAASVLGNGSRVTAPDTVPLALWLAARHRDSFADAMWETVSAGGDIDTNAAIVGGIVALWAPAPAVPGEWIARREPLKFESA